MLFKTCYKTFTVHVHVSVIDNMLIILIYNVHILYIIECTCIYIHCVDVSRRHIDTVYMYINIIKSNDIFYSLHLQYFTHFIQVCFLCYQMCVIALLRVFLLRAIAVLQTCFVSQDYEDDLLECMGNNSHCQATISLEQFDLPEGAHLK